MEGGEKREKGNEGRARLRYLEKDFRFWNLEILEISFCLFFLRKEKEKNEGEKKKNDEKKTVSRT